MTEKKIEKKREKKKEWINIHKYVSILLYLLSGMLLYNTSRAIVLFIKFLISWITINPEIYTVYISDIYKFIAILIILIILINSLAFLLFFKIANTFLDIYIKKSIKN